MTCQAMEAVVRLRDDAVLLPYASERLEVAQVCPLDGEQFPGPYSPP